MAKLYEKDFTEYEEEIKKKALEAFLDDRGNGDITTNAIFEYDTEAEANIIAEEDCILAGALEARAIFGNAQIQASGKEDGTKVKKGEIILSLNGSLKELLARERVALNYISRMSGIATLSRGLYEKHGKKILFLRKTDPGLLFSEKRAVSLGGCLPHRINLSDGILIKDNHIDLLAGGPDRKTAILEAIKRADSYRKSILNGKNFLPIEIEADSFDEAKIAALSLAELDGPNIILLDNMSPEEVKKSVKDIRDIDKDIVTEASGGITRENISDYLAAGADYVSTSMFLSARPCSFKLEVIR